MRAGLIGWSACLLACASPHGSSHDQAATTQVGEGGLPLDASTALLDAGRPVAPLALDSAVAGSWGLCDTLVARAGLAALDTTRLSWPALLCETVDLERLTRAPEPPYRVAFASSYDRHATAEGADGWFANDDSGQYLRDQADEHVMMEASGPGVLTRLWSANPSGRIRIYIDDLDVPAVDAPMADFLSGHSESSLGEPFAFVAASGYNSYFPIPYTSYARVSTTSSDALYYQVDSRSYPVGTQLEPYSQQGLQALAPLARELTAFLQAPSEDPLVRRLPMRDLELGAATPEQSERLGPAVIRELVVTGFDASESALRGTRLILTVDGERTVDAPLGDLFASGPGLKPYESLAASMTDSALTLRWPMPVHNELSARIESSRGELADLRVRVRYSQGLPNEPRLFHALWTGVQTLSSRTPTDWTLLHVDGTGWYVGTMLNVGNPSNLWWGEGDEKIFVDGETFPSHFGTGTEDYFGLAWCSTELVARPWIGQTRADGPGNAGRSSMYRWHVADAIPFSSELRFRLEVATWLKDLVSLPITQDAVGYWYARPGAVALDDTLDLTAFEVPTLASMALPSLPGPSTCGP